MGNVVCLCGDAMITVSHYFELADVSWCIADTIIGETRDDMALYFIGHREPNYPVPAIISRVAFFDTGLEWIRYKPNGGFDLIKIYNY